MATLFLTHSVCLQHDTGDYHPECAERLRAVQAVLAGDRFSGLIRAEAPLVARDNIERAHCPHHVEHVLSIFPTPGESHYLDPDTVMSEHTVEAAMRSAGAVVEAVTRVAKGEAKNAFCAVRPPGHHAERDAAMGFCFFNNAAIGALYARDVLGFEKVAVVDFDVHHGNGTQHILWDEPGTFYGSTHQEHAYPNTGLASETGGQGTMVNVPLAAGTTSDEFRQAFGDLLVYKLRQWRPDFIIISAGFDAHMADPLAHLRLKTTDFRWATEKLLEVADECAGSRVVSVLEGGYDIQALCDSVDVHVTALMNA